MQKSNCLQTGGNNKRMLCLDLVLPATGSKTDYASDTDTSVQKC